MVSNNKLPPQSHSLPGSDTALIIRDRILSDQLPLWVRFAHGVWSGLNRFLRSKPAGLNYPDLSFYTLLVFVASVRPIPLHNQISELYGHQRSANLAVHDEYNWLGISFHPNGGSRIPLPEIVNVKGLDGTAKPAVRCPEGSIVPSTLRGCHHHVPPLWALGVQPRHEGPDIVVAGRSRNQLLQTSRESRADFKHRTIGPDNLSLIGIHNHLLALLKDMLTKACDYL
jgi:hypothetical protein